MAFLLVGCAKQFESARRKHGTTLPPLGALRRRRGRRYEAGSRAESFVIVSGSDLRKASVAVMSVRSCRWTGLPLVRASHGPDDFK
jgi:hypothetical protein